MSSFDEMLKECKKKLECYKWRLMINDVKWQNCIMRLQSPNLPFKKRELITSRKEKLEIKWPKLENKRQKYENLVLQMQSEISSDESESSEAQ